MTITDNIIWKLLNDPLFDKLNQTSRWNGLKTYNKESVAQHSFSVSLYSRIMGEMIFRDKDTESKLKLVTYAIFHDFDEIFTGDVSHDLKYNTNNGTQIRNLLDDYIASRMEWARSGDISEKMMRDNVLGFVPPYIKKINKVSDWLSMTSFLLGEIASGNNSIRKEFEYCKVSTKKAAIDAINSLNTYYPDQCDLSVLELIKNHDIV